MVTNVNKYKEQGRSSLYEILLIEKDGKESYF